MGQGIGATLMKACLDEATQRGCGIIWLDVWERNLRARAFYHKWGFIEVGTQVFQLGDDLQNDLLMQRPVNNDHPRITYARK
jgi:ribosomal protein S18 acetylase RimI-like enzyme